ncbi:hypothetical protein C900_00898 [Fulvivirga imtechensis AK7]|uniref:Transporter n=1 Tax=Fulvivirga imtechensis AK7 TaxID=1237149 RepID=L8K0D1_9BACT|nr:hypothetical protein [Fulvivirga imtechensis]ELR72937.1 hypothetical protein C900_00898 [Fulvivirga imtechensis AK7]
MNSRLVLAVFLIASASTAMAGGGWPQPKGKVYLKLSQWWVISDQHFTNTGQIDPNLTRGAFNTSIYGEYGFTDRLTGILYFPFFSRATLNEQVSGTTGMLISEGDAVNSVGDADISLKYGLITNKPIVVSASLTLGLPLGNDSGGRDGSLQTGDGEFNQMITIDVSKSFKIGDLYPFLTVSAGFNNRTNDYSDEFRYGVEGGITFKKFTGILRVYGIKSLQNGEENFNAMGTSLFANNVEYMSFSPELAYNFTESLGISASYGTAFSGKLIYANPSYSVGVFLKF